MTASRIGCLQCRKIPGCEQGQSDRPVAARCGRPGSTRVVRVGARPPESHDHHGVADRRVHPNRTRPCPSLLIPGRGAQDVDSIVLLHHRVAGRVGPREGDRAVRVVGGLRGHRIGPIDAHRHHVLLRTLRPLLRLGSVRTNTRAETTASARRTGRRFGSCHCRHFIVLRSPCKGSTHTRTREDLQSTPRQARARRAGGNERGGKRHKGTTRGPTAGGGENEGGIRSRGSMTRIKLTRTRTHEHTSKHKNRQRAIGTLYQPNTRTGRGR